MRGGIGTLIVVVSAAFLFPQIRRHGRLDAAPGEHTEDFADRSDRSS